MTTRTIPLEQLTTRNGFWDATEGKSTGSRTHRLRKDGERLVFLPRTTHLAVSALWVVAGTAVALWALLGKSEFLTPRNRFTWIVLGGMFAALFGYQIHLAFDPIVFDRRSGFFRRGRERAASGESDESVRIPLADIVALQLILGEDAPRRFYELNLVLANGERAYLVDHGDKRAMTEDAETLSRFLGVPVLQGALRFETLADEADEEAA